MTTFKEPNSAPMQMQYGELTLAFTNQMERRWNTEGTGQYVHLGSSRTTLAPGKYQASFHHPKPPPGFYALGSVAVDDLKDDGNLVALCVKGTIGTGNDGAPLVHPTGYERIWSSKDTISKHKGACWRPIPPNNAYAALGHVFTNSHKTPPALTDVVCVHKDRLGYKGNIGARIYDTTNVETKKHFSAWRLDVREYNDPTQGLIAAQTFIGKTGRSKPEDDAAAWVLKVPFPSESYDTADAPTLVDEKDPGTTTTPVVDALVWVPFTAVEDHDLIDSTGEGKISVGWQVENTPFYAIRRSTCYTRQLHRYNTTSLDQTAGPKVVTTGVSTEEREEFAVETGVKVSAGVSVSGLSASAEVSRSLRFTTSTSTTTFEQTSHSYSLVVPTMTAAALYTLHHDIELFRGDGRRVGDTLSFEAEGTTITVQYPASASATTTVKVIEG